MQGLLLFQTDRSEQFAQPNAVQAAEVGQFDDIQSPLAGFSLGNVGGVHPEFFGHVHLREPRVFAGFALRAGGADRFGNVEISTSQATARFFVAAAQLKLTYISEETGNEAIATRKEALPQFRSVTAS